MSRRHLHGSRSGANSAYPQCFHVHVHECARESCRFRLSQALAQNVRHSKPWDLLSLGFCNLHSLVLFLNLCRPVIMKIMLLPLCLVLAISTQAADETA